MLNDADLVTFSFQCCGKRRIVALAELKKSPMRQFLCQNASCGEHVYYDPAEYVALINKDKGDPDLTISLHPL
jgi:hypothetical protein